MQKESMNVLTDLHHASLLQSFILLFEKRLGGNVYRPIGTEWFEQGYWHVFSHPATVQQFLGIGGATPDGSAKLNEVIENPQEGIYHCYDIDSGESNKAITLDAFLKMDFDIVIATLPQHVTPFKKLCELHPSKPKLIYQIGNAWDTSILAPNIMASAKIYGLPLEINKIEYHQEFDTYIFAPNIPQLPELYKTWGDSQIFPKENIFSFVNVFNGQQHFAEDWKLFLDMERIMEGWNFKSYGGQCRDEAIGPAKKVANKMKEAMFIWHTKAGGDGYGHVIHNAFAMARPPIVKMQYYQSKMAGQLMIDNETCIAIDNLSQYEIMNKIKHYSTKDEYRKLSRGAYAKFKEIVDFDREAKEIQIFLDNLQ